MGEPADVRAANQIMERLHPLDVTISNALGFCLLLKDLRGRDWVVTEPHASAIRLVRAVILRAERSVSIRTDRKGGASVIGLARGRFTKNLRTRRLTDAQPALVTVADDVGQAHFI